MEVWWTGSHTEPQQMLAVLGFLAVPVFALNRTSGFRARRDTRLRDAADDTVEALAVGILVTLGVLVLVHEITPDSALEPSLGKVVYESVPFCLGVGVARHFLRGSRSDDDEEGGSDEVTEAPPKSQLHPTIADLAATVLGATFVALSIAPTDEVPMIAAATRPAWLLAFMAASLLTSYGIVFVAGFGDQEGRQNQEGPFQRPITETVVSYLVSLSVAGLPALAVPAGRGALRGPAGPGRGPRVPGRHRRCRRAACPVSTPHDPRTAAEWIALACSCLLLGVLTGLIVWRMGSEREPAAPVVEIAEAIRTVDGVHHVEVVVSNEGDTTAANVQVTAELTIGGTTSTADQLIDFLPGGAEEELVFVFEDDPAEGELSVVVSGFSVP